MLDWLDWFIIVAALILLALVLDEFVQRLINPDKRPPRGKRHNDT